MRQARMRSQAQELQGTESSLSIVAKESSTNIPSSSSLIGLHPAASRIGNTQPTYDFLTGTSINHTLQPLQQTFRQSQASKPGKQNIMFRMVLDLKAL